MPGMLILFIPQELFYTILKYSVAVWCAGNSVILFLSWKSKKGKIKILAARNRKEIRPDTFKKLRKTICGMLMADIVIWDLRKTENYKELPEAEWKELKRKAFGTRSKKVKRKESASAVGVLEKLDHE